MNEGKCEWTFLSLGKGEISPSYSAIVVMPPPFKCLAEILGHAVALEKEQEKVWKRRQEISKGRRGQGAEPLGAGS